MRVLWCVTGAGHLLRECVEAMENSKDEITIALSSAGEEVARMYGLIDRVMGVGPETVLEREQGKSFPASGRMARKEYDTLVVAPCTANTLAKAVNGIADSLASNLIAQAQKNEIPVVILPTDSEEFQRTEIPVTIEPEKCKGCEPCPPMQECPAFYRAERIRIELLRCNACRKCIPLCKNGAITFGQEAVIRSREADLENLSRLGEMEGIKVITKPEELYSL